MLILPPRTSWFYRYTVSLSSMRRYLLTLLFIALCALAWFFYIYEPMQMHIDRAQQLGNTARTQSAEDLKATIAELQQQLSAQPLSLSGDDQLQAVLGYSDQANLNLEYCAVQDGVIVFQATGTFKQIQSFFDHLLNTTQQFSPSNIRITRGVDSHFALSIIIRRV